MHDQDTYARTRAPANAGGAHEAGDAGSKVAVAADTAKATVKDEARNVAGTAKQEAGAVVGEARSQVRRIASQARDQATDRVRGQHNQLVDRLRGLADEFQEMGADGDSPGKALVGDLGQRGRRVADYLADRGPEGLVSEVTDFARRRPMAFLAGAVAAGFLVGRLGKGVWKAQSESGSGSSSGSSSPAAAPYPPESFVDTEPVTSVVEPYGSQSTVGTPQWSQPPVTASASVPPVAATPAAAPVTPAVPPMPATEPFTPNPYASESYDDPTRPYGGGERQ